MTDVHDFDDLRKRAEKLRLYGLLTRWDELCTQPWVADLIELEEVERGRRSREYRVKNATIGAFKPIADFEWDHPKKIDRALVEDLFTLAFIRESTNVIFFGPNGLGKTMLAKNLAHHAVLRGHTVRFLSASDLLNDLAGVDGSALRHRLKRYVNPKLLVVDEVAYLNYDNRYADLFYQVVSRRYDKGAPIVISTNKVFTEWNQVFDSAACVVSLVDRLRHRAEFVAIEGESYRQKEAERRKKERAAKRKKRSPKGR